MNYNSFHRALYEVINKMKAGYANQITEVRPRIHNLDYLVDLHEELSLTPLIILRESNSDRRNYSLDLLKGLLMLGNEIYHEV